MCAADGRHEPALQMFGAAEAQAERSGLKRDSADSAFLLPLIEQSQRALGAAARMSWPQEKDWTTPKRCSALPSC